MGKAELSRRFGVSRRTIPYWIESGQLDRDQGAGGTRDRRDRARAGATGRGEGTIRRRAKRIFRDRGISRQRELVRLVLSLADFPQGRS